MPAAASPAISKVEAGCWVALVLMGAGFRLWSLDSRPFSYDEAIHAWYSWQLAETGWYAHNPVTHGPLLFYVNALVYVVLGAGDGTARLVPALAGTGLILTPLLFRRWLGGAAALAVGCLFATSPLLIFFSRYLRNDIYIALLFTLWIWAVFRYWERPSPSAFYPVALLSALAVTVKEVAFIGAAILVVFLLVETFRARTGRSSPALDLVILQATLFAPFGFVLLIHLVVGGDLWSRFQGRPAPAFAMAAGGAVLAWIGLFAWTRWAPETNRATVKSLFGPVALAWIVEGLYFSTFLKNPGGLATGFFGSVAYWLSQQPVARGGQPWFYYPGLLKLYEFLPLFLALSVLVAWGCRVCRPDSGEEGMAPVVRRFFVFWLVAALPAYTVAGEKMPWLAIHLLLPLCWVGGEGAWRILNAATRRGLPPVWVVPGLALAGFAAFVRTAEPVAGPLDEARVAGSWLGLVSAGLGILLVVSVGLRRRQPVWPGLWLGTLLLLILLSGWVSVRLNHIQPQSPYELVNYAAADPEIDRLVRFLTSEGDGLSVQVEPAAEWPLRWYLRDVSDVRWGADIAETGRNRFPLMPIMVRGEAWDPPEGYRSEVFGLLTWPPDRYRTSSPVEWGALVNGRRNLQRMWRVFYDAAYPEEFSGFRHHRRRVRVAVPASREVAPSSGENGR